MSRAANRPARPGLRVAVEPAGHVADGLQQAGSAGDNGRLPCQTMPKDSIRTPSSIGSIVNCPDCRYGAMASGGSAASISLPRSRLVMTGNDDVWMTRAAAAASVPRTSSPAARATRCRPAADPAVAGEIGMHQRAARGERMARPRDHRMRLVGQGSNSRSALTCGPMIRPITQVELARQQPVHQRQAVIHVHGDQQVRRIALHLRDRLRGTRLVPGFTTVPMATGPAGRRAGHRSRRRRDRSPTRPRAPVAPAPCRTGRLHAAGMALEQFHAQHGLHLRQQLEAAGWVMFVASAARNTERCSSRCSSSHSCRVLSRDTVGQCAICLVMPLPHISRQGIENGQIFILSNISRWHQPMHGPRRIRTGIADDHASATARPEFGGNGTRGTQQRVRAVEGLMSQASDRRPGPARTGIRVQAEHPSAGQGGPGHRSSERHRAPRPPACSPRMAPASSADVQQAASADPGPVRRTDPRPAVAVATRVRHGRIDAGQQRGGDVFSDPPMPTTIRGSAASRSTSRLHGTCPARLLSMLERGSGSIVNIASVHGHKIIPGCFRTRSPSTA